MFTHLYRMTYLQLISSQYYRKVGATYRNPHFPGVRNVLFHWFNRYVSSFFFEMQSLIRKVRLWAMEGDRISRSEFNVFDMACGQSTPPFDRVGGL